MNAELLSTLNAKYKEYLFTPRGRKLLTDAVRLKKEWNETKTATTTQFQTAGVNLKKIGDSQIASKISKINIIPIGLNNMCHINSQFFCKEISGVQSVLGYNLTACPCGKIMSFEPHSVNKIGDTLYDFTKDFNEETEKYFLELNTQLDAHTYIEIFSGNPIVVNNGCRCPINWGNTRKYTKSISDFGNMINMIENICVYS